MLLVMMQLLLFLTNVTHFSVVDAVGASCVVAFKKKIRFIGIVAVGNVVIDIIVNYAVGTTFPSFHRFTLLQRFPPFHRHFPNDIEFRSDELKKNICI